MPLLVICKFDKYLIKGYWEKLETPFSFTAEGHLTPKWLVRSGRNSNPSKILCLSFLPVRLMKIEFIVTGEKWRHHFLHYKSMGKFQRSSANNSKVNNPIRPKFKFIRAFMPVLITRKFDKDPIKGDWEKLETSFSFTAEGHLTPKWLVRSGRNSNPSKILCLSFLPVRLMKIEFIVTGEKWRHHFLHYKSMGKFQCSRANNSKVNYPIRPKFKFIRAFMPVLITRKFDKDPIKGDWEKLETSFFSLLKGHVTPKWLVRYDRNSNLSEILCLSLLPVSLMKTEFIVTEKRWRHHFPPFKVNGNAQGRITLYSKVRPGPNLNSSKICCLPLLPTSLTKIRLKVTEKMQGHRFAHYMSMEAFSWYSNHSFDPTWPKT